MVLYCKKTRYKEKIYKEAFGPGDNFWYSLTVIVKMPNLINDVSYWKDI